MIFNRKDFLGLKEVSADEIMYILETADTMKYILSKKSKKSPYLQGRSVVTAFYEKSSRTRVSYELAAQYLNANIVDMKVSVNNSVGESLTDMGRIIDQMGADFIILRHPMAGAAKMLAENVSASVLNAGDGLNENPSQAIIDLMTIKDRKNSFKDLKVVLIGDIFHSRVAKSNIWALLELGSEVHVAAPPTLLPSKLEEMNVRVHYNANNAVKDADVIMAISTNIDKLEKNMLPNINEYKNFFRIDAELLKHAKKDAIVMSPTQINRDIEIASTVMDSGRCLSNDQIINGVAVRMALLYLLSMKGGVLYENNN